MQDVGYYNFRVGASCDFRVKHIRKHVFRTDDLCRLERAFISTCLMAMFNIGLGLKASCRVQIPYSVGLAF